MVESYISKSIFNFNYLEANYSWFNIVSINGYPITGMIINVLLLLIPFYIVIYLTKYFNSNKLFKIHQKLIGIALGFIWLIFIPNTAYIINDARHLMNICAVNSPFRVCAENAWMIIVFFTYAAIGWLSLVYLINQMKNFIGKLFSEKAKKIFPVLIIPLISLGVLLGLLNRWNSWEIFIYPVDFMRHVFLYFYDLVYLGNWLIYTVCLYILYYVGDFVFKKEFKK